VALVVGVSGGASGGLTASVRNTGDTVQTGDLVTAAASGGTTECDLSTSAYSPISTTNGASCSGTLLGSGTLPSTGTSSVATVVSDKGSLAGTAGGLTAGACGPVELANAAGSNADPLLVRGSPVNFAQSGPSRLSGSGGLGLSGTSGYAADVAGTTPPTTGFTEAIWFRTTTSGTLLGFASTPSSYNPSAQASDRMLWVDGAGHVVFGIYPTITTDEVTTTGVYNDGNWHLAVASVNLVGGMSLSVDAGTAATNVLALLDESYAGYWHVGWDYYSSAWSDPPSHPYFSGTLADAAVFPSALSTAQVTALYATTSQSDWASLVATDGASDSWPLSDTGTTAYTGAVPDVTPSSCAFVDATVAVTTTAGTTCAAPPGASGCPAPSSAVTLATLAGRTTSFALSPTPSVSLTVTVIIARDGTDTVTAYPYATGLHLTGNLALVTDAGAFTATLTWPGENVIL
jgi:hypothetical protein